MLGIVVFVGQNMFCDAKHATKRATDDNWKRDVAGSNKRSFIYQVIDCYFVIESFFRKKKSYFCFLLIGTITGSLASIKSNIL